MKKISKIIFLTFLFLLFSKSEFVFGVCDERFGTYAEQAAKQVLGCEEVKIGNRLIKTKDIILAEIAHESCCGNPKCGSFRRPIYYHGKGADYIMNLCKQLGRDPESWDPSRTCVVTFDGGMGWAQYMPDTWKDLIVKGGYPYGVKDPWNDRDAAYLVAIHLKKRAGPGGFCENPVESIKKYNGDGLAYVHKVLENLGKNIKEIAGEIKREVTEEIEKTIERFWKEYNRLELEYPEIFGLKPKEVKIGLEFFKYIYLFVIWSLGFLLFIVLLYYGILWYTAGANIEQALRAKQKIIQAFFGAILLLGSWILLEILGPQFTKIQKEIPPPQEIITLPGTRKKEGEKVVVAKRIVIDHLVNKSILSPSATTTPTKASFNEILKYRTFGVNTASDEIQFGLGEEQGFAMDNVSNSDASYNWREAFVSDEERNQVKENAEKFKNRVSNESGKKEYKTTIREVRTSIPPVEEQCRICLEKCCSSCEELSKECQKVMRLRTLAENFPPNEEYASTTKSLEEKREGVNKIEYGSTTKRFVYEIEEEVPRGDYSHYKDEDYYERGEKAVEEILNLSRTINCSLIDNCYIKEKENNNKENNNEECKAMNEKVCAEMKSIIETFAKGWETRQTGWRVIKKSEEVATKQFQYINLIRENIKSGTDYLYEGTVAPSRIERILGTNKVLKTKTDYAKNLALTTEALSAAITTLLVGGCHCIECSALFSCKGGDVCIVVRPLLSALQVALGMNIVAMPPVGQQVQKEVDKEIRESDELKKSLEELTEGLALAEKEIFTCQGITKNGEFKQLFSAAEFLNYKKGLEQQGYKIIIQDLWPNIESKGDAFVFYCVTGPLVERISDIYNPNNLKNLKLYCDQSTESEVGELFDKIKYVVKEKEQILEQKSKEIKNAQKLVNEMRRNQKRLELTLKGDFEGDLSQVANVLKNVSGDLFAKMIGQLSEKYAKEAIGNIIENVAGKDVKDFFIKAFESMKDGDFKEMLNKYFSSMMDKEVKKFTHEFLDVIPNKNLKNILVSGFDSLSERQVKDFWKNSWKNFTENEKTIFFSKYFRDTDPKTSEILFDYFVENSSEVEKRKLLKEILEVSDQSTIKRILENYIKISSNPMKNEGSADFVKPDTLILEQVISEIPSKELREILKETKEILTEKDLLKNAMRNVSHEILESAISRMPESEIKKFTHYFYDGIDESDIKDFVLETILDADPTFFQKFIKELPEKRIKDLILEQGFKAIPDSHAKEVFFLMHELPNMDARKVLNYLFLNYVPRDKLSSAMGVLQTVGIIDRFLAEASAVFGFPNVRVSEIIKDMVDKIASFTEKLQDMVNQIIDTIQLTRDQLVNYVQDVWNQIPNTTVGELLEDVIKEIPYQDLLTSIKEALKSFSLDELKSIGREIFDQLDLGELRKTFQDILDGLPIEEIKSALNDVILALPLEEMKNLLNELSFATKSEIFRECIYPYLTKEEQLKFPKPLSEEELKYYISRLQSKRGIYCALKYIPERELKQMLKEAVSKIPKEDLVVILSNLSSIRFHLDKFVEKLSQEALKKILKAFPEKELKNFFGTLAKKLSIQKLRLALNMALAVFKNTVNKLFHELLSKLPSVVLDDLVKQLLSSLPVTELVETFKQMISQLSTEVLGPILDQLQELFGTLSSLFSLLTGGPGLKQNALMMLSYPTHYLTACARCCWGFPVCKGIPGPLIIGSVNPPVIASVCNPWPVLKRMALITINVGKIVFFKDSLDKALNTEENIIENKIKKDIWPSVTQDTHIFSSRQCVTIEPGKEGYLVKCEDALRYGWVRKCDHKNNFVCCKRR